MPRPSHRSAPRIVAGLAALVVGSTLLAPADSIAAPIAAIPRAGSEGSATVGSTTFDSTTFDSTAEGEHGTTTPLPDGLRIRDVADRRGLLVGALLANSDLGPGQERLQDLYRTQVNAVTVTSYWFQVATRGRGQYVFASADPVAQFAVDNGLRARGHVLFWHVLNPGWLENLDATREEAIVLMEEHADAVIGHFETEFPGLIEQWDVVNEAIDNDGSRRGGVWQRLVGDDWVEQAFLATEKALDKYGSDATMFYNEYFDLGLAAGAEATSLAPGTSFDDGDVVPLALGGSAGPLPCEAIVKCRGAQDLVRELLAAEAPIDGVGFQAHLANPVPADFSVLTSWVGDLGLSWIATELDVPVPRGSSDHSTQHQADAFANVAGACVADSACDGVVTWGLTDAHTWFNNLNGGALSEALHFDASLAPKPAAYAYQAALEG